MSFLAKIFKKKNKIKIYEVDSVPIQKPIVLKDTINNSGMENLSICKGCGLAIHKDMQVCPHCDTYQ